MLFGGILLACGLLIMGLSGLCTAYFVVIFLAGGGLTQNGGIGFLLLPLLFGGIPFAIGFGLFSGGRALIRSARADEQG